MKYNFVQLKIDHLKGIVQFGSEVKKFNFLVLIILNTKPSFPFEDDASMNGLFLKVRKIFGGFICAEPRVRQDSKSFNYSCEALKQG